MIFAVFDPSPLTMCINCSFFTFMTIKGLLYSTCPMLKAFLSENF